MNAIIRYILDNGILLILLLALYLINPFSINHYIGYLLTPIILIHSNFIKKNLDFDLVLLLLFSAFYALFYSFNATAMQGKQFIVIYALSPITFYLMGKFLIRNNLSPKGVYYILFVIGVLFSTSAVISVFINFQEGGFAQLDRTIPMFWNGNPVSATIMGGFLTFNMCIPALIITSQGKKGWAFNIAAAGLFIISLICVIRLGSRTQLGIFLTTSIFALLYIMPRQTIKKNAWLLGLIAALVLYLIQNVSFDLNADWLTTFAGRLSGGSDELVSGGGRMERWTKSLEYLISHPLGWEIKEFGYSHNLWLDVLRVSGIIPFILLVVYSIRSYLQIKKTVNINKENIYLNALILIFSIAFLLLFMMEPIFEGLYTFFLVFCLFKGIVNKYHTNSIAC